MIIITNNITRGTIHARVGCKRGKSLRELAGSLSHAGRSHNTLYYVLISYTIRYFHILCHDMTVHYCYTIVTATTWNNCARRAKAQDLDRGCLSKLETCYADWA